MIIPNSNPRKSCHSKKLLQRSLVRLTLAMSLLGGTSLLVAGGKGVAIAQAEVKNLSGGDGSEDAVNLRKECDIYLSQDDFAEGTVVIKSPGLYCLREDISFNPNNAAYLRRKTGDFTITAYDASQPLRTQLGFGPGQYDPAAFGLGFFTAIAVAADGVTIDLQGYTLEQSKEHALLQRFFSLIETADRPFISGQGPHNFGEGFYSAKDLTIQNGKLGRSSHHGIHGNGPVNLTIKDLRIDGFEVAAIALNGAKNVLIQNVSLASQKSVPITGLFSTAQFLKPYIEYLARRAPTLSFNGKSALLIRQNLRDAVNHVHEDLIGRDLLVIDPKRHYPEWRLFHNTSELPDGNQYGILINGLGAAVGSFPLAKDILQPSEEITMENVTVESLQAHVRESVALAASADEKSVVTDPVGSLLRLFYTDPDGLPLALSDVRDLTRAFYTGNVVSDAQALVARAIDEGLFPDYLSTKRNTISAELVQWMETREPLSSQLAKLKGAFPTGLACNGDQMFHVNKGVVAFKLDGAKKLNLQKARVFEAENLGLEGSTLCGEYEKSHPDARLPGYGGAVTRAISVSGSSLVRIADFKAQALSSRFGSVYGIDLLGDSSNIELDHVFIEGVRVSEENTKKPNFDPLAVGVRIGIDVNKTEANTCCVKDLSGFDTLEMMDLSGRAVVYGMCE